MLEPSKYTYAASGYPKTNEVESLGRQCKWKKGEVNDRRKPSSWVALAIPSPAHVSALQADDGVSSACAPPSVPPVLEGQ